MRFREGLAQAPLIAKTQDQIPVRFLTDAHGRITAQPAQEAIGVVEAGAANRQDAGE